VLETTFSNPYASKRIEDAGPSRAAARHLEVDFFSALSARATGAPLVAGKPETVLKKMQGRVFQSRHERRTAPLPSISSPRKHGRPTPTTCVGRARHRASADVLEGLQAQRLLRRCSA